MKDYRAASHEAFDRQAGQYDKSAYSHHARQLHPFLLSQLAQIPHSQVLDLGCGTGELLTSLLGRWPDCRCAGLDLSEKMLQTARNKLGSRAELVLGDAAALPFADGRFDAVICCDSFHHYPQPEQVLEQVARVLQPGGVFLLADCTAPGPVRALTNALLPFGSGGDVHIYSPRELEDLLGRFFHGVSCRSTGSGGLLAWGLK